MFGKKKEEKKDDELKKADEEQKKLEAIAAAEAKEPKEAKDESLEGLKNMGDMGSPGGGEPKEEAPREEMEQEEENIEETHRKEPKKDAHHPKKAEAEEKDEAGPEETHEKKKKADPETLKLRKQLETQKDTIKSLEKERGEAMKKSDELAELIEDLSSEVKEVKSSSKKEVAQPAIDIEPRLRELQEKMGSQIGELKSAIQSMATKGDEDKEGEEQVAETMKKMFDKRLKELTDKLEDVRPQPSGKDEGARPGEVSGGLMAMGGGIEFQNEIDKLKKSIKDIATLMDAFKEEAENRFLAIDRELETVEKLPDLEDKMEQFEKKLGQENVQKLRTLISSADDIKQEFIPRTVKRAVEENLDPFSKRVKGIEDALEKTNAKTQGIAGEMDTDKKEIKTLWKFEDRISKLEDGIAEIKKIISETRASIRDLDKAHQKATEEKIKELLPKMLEAEASSLKKEFAGRFAFMDDKLDSAENTVSESRKEISELAVLKGEVGKMDDEMVKLKEMDEKLLNRINALKAEDADLEDKIETLKTPKEIITELDNKTKDILEIREFFVRRADGLEDMIKKLDTRAVPVEKINEKVDSLLKEIAGLREAHTKLEQKTESEKRELHVLIRQHAEEKKHLEEKLNEQRVRISTLIKEFR